MALTKTEQLDSLYTTTWNLMRKKVVDKKIVHIKPSLNTGKATK